MRYQDLIDKYSSPSYNIGAPTSTNIQTYNRLDITSKTQYTSEAELPSKYRSKSRKHLDYCYNTASLISPNRYTDNKLPDSSTDPLFRPTPSDILTSTNRSPSPISATRRTNLRETATPDYYRQGTTKRLGYNNSSSNLLSSGVASSYQPNFNLTSDLSPKKLPFDKYLGTDYSRQNNFLSPSTSAILLTKENNPPQDTSYLHLTQSSHQKKNIGSKASANSDQMFSSSAGMAAFTGKSSKQLEVDHGRQARMMSNKSVKDLDIEKAPPTSKFLQEKKNQKVDKNQVMNGEFGPYGFTNICKADFQVGKCKGEGKFGKIYPAKHIKTGTLYALKQIPKKIIKQNMMQDQLLREIKLQYFFNHSNLVKLYGFFADDINIYLLMQYMEQGELYSLLKKQKKFTQAFTASRVHEVCEALHYLHDMDVVHRDIKLENVVLSNGVAKLCDFGWAAPINGRRTTYCGTFDYASPEIIEGKDYDQNVDLWSLGVMTFEMMTGQLPFYSISRSQTIKNILNVEQKKINFPPEMSAKAQSFIEKLLRKNPQQRVNIAMLLKHPFLEDCTKTHKKF